MADAPEATAKGGLGFLKQKAGPLPIGVWLVIAIGLVLYFQHQDKKASASATPNQQTDPAGNVGTIDPATGYVSGTPEDQAALAASNAGSGGGSSGSQATPTAQSYADNNTWGIAAVNYLVGLGIDATTANQAIQLFLSSQPLTTAQQGDVNLAIQALGPPPSLPGPVTGNPPPVTTPPSGTGTAVVPRVTGLSNVAAGKAITASGLVPGPQVTVTGVVNSQTPGAGVKVKKGSTVDIGVKATSTPPSGGKPGGPGTPPKGGKTAPVPTGLVVSAKHSTSASVKWNASRGASGYRVLCTDMATKAVKGQLSTTTTTATFGSLTPSHSYVFDVWALPDNGAHAEVSATLPRTG